MQNVTILETTVSPNEPKHQTPWLKQWTEHTIEIPEDEAEARAKSIQNAIETIPQAWYADYKNNKTHYKIFSSVRS